MRSVDERIVEMQFDNKQFESGIQTSIKSLDELNKSLNDSSKNGALQGLQAGVDVISSRFSALGIMGVTALQNITNSVINTGTQMVRSLTIAPIAQGLDEYELKMGAIQTIMAGSGESLDVVNQKLAELNKYSDTTIYSFRDMTSNIGKFTNAGVKLDDAVLAIKGISNEAALSGANAEEASRAMYNFAQALSAGHVKLVDWKSIENANMATVEFKEQLLEAAAAAGTLEKQADGMYKVLTTDAGGRNFDQLIDATHNFNDSLTYQWMTTDALIPTLKEYADETSEIGKKAQAAAQEIKTFSQLMDTVKESVGSGWATTFEIIIGDFEEAKQLWSQVSEVFGDVVESSATARNELLQGWKSLGGRNALLDSFKNAFMGISNIIAPIKDAFTDIFPPTTAKTLYDITKSIETMTEKFRLFTLDLRLSDDFQNTFRGLFAVLDIGRQAVEFLIDKFGDLLSVILPVGDGLLGLTGDIGSFLVGVNESIRSSDAFNKAFDTVKSAVGSVAGAIKDDLKGMMETPAFQTLQDAVSKASEKLKEGLDELKEMLDDFSGVDLSGIKTFADTAVENFRPFTAFGNMLSSGFALVRDVLAKVMPFFVNLGHIAGEAFGWLGKAISDAFDVNGIQGVFDLINSGLFAGILLGIKTFIDSLSDISDGASGFFGGLNDILTGLKDTLAAYQAQLKAGTLMTIASAIAILAGSLVVLSLIDSQRLAVAIGAISALFAELTGTMVLLEKSFKGSKMTKVAGQMVAMSVAVLVLSVAMEKMAALSWDDLLKGTVGVGILASTLVASAKILSSGEQSMIKGGVGLIAFSAAIVILANAVESLGVLDVDTLAKGLVSVGVLMAEVAGFTQLVKPDKLLGTGIAMVAMGAAITILTNAVENLSRLSIEELAKGLGSVGVIFAEVAGFTQLVKPDKLLGTGIAMITMGAAMLIFAQAISQMGSLSIEEIGKGLLSMAGTLGIVVAATLLMPSDIGVKAGGMLILSAALVVLSQAMQNMGGMSWEDVAKSLIVLAGSLTVITIAINAMTGGLAGAAAMLVMSVAILALTPALMLLGSMDLASLGVALLALIGVFVIVGGAAVILAPLTPVILALSAAIALLGVAVLAIGAGILAFSAGLTALGVAGTAGVAALVAMVAGLLGLIPLAFEELGKGIVALASVIADGTPAIMEALKAIFEGLIQLLGELLPPLISVIFQFVDGLLTTLVEYTPKFVDAGMKILLGLLQGISDHIGDVVIVTLSIIENFLNGLASGIPGIVSAAVNIMNAFMMALANEIPRLIETGFLMIIVFCNGLADVIRANAGLLGEAAANLGTAIVEGIITGIASYMGTVVDKIVEVAESMWNGFCDFFGIHSPSTVAMKAGEDINQGIVIGLHNSKDKAVAKTTEVASEMEEALETGVESMGGIGEQGATEFVDGINGMIPASMDAGDSLSSSSALGLSSNGAEFGNLATLFGSDYTAMLSGNQDAAYNSGNLLSSTSLDGLGFNIPEFGNMGKLSGSEYTSGLSSNTEPAALAGDDISQISLDALLENQDSFSSSGNMSGDMFAGGLSEKSSVVENASGELSSASLSGLDGLDNQYYDIGVNSGEGLAKGLSAQKDAVYESAVGLARSAEKGAKAYLDINSPSKLFEEEIGRNTALGMARGIENNTDDVSKATVKMADEAYKNAKMWIADYQNDTDYLATEELAMWETLGKEFSDYTKEKVEIGDNEKRLREKILKDIEQAEKEQFDATKTYIDRKKKMNQLSAQDEIALWKNLQLEYAEGSDFYQEIDLKMYEAKEQAEKDSFENSKSWIEQKKQLNELSLLEEVQAWERVQARYAEGTEQRKEADVALYEAREALFARQDELLTMMSDAESDYQQAVDDRAKAIAGTWGIFDELQEKEEVVGKTLIQNLKEQVAEMHEWAADLQTLTRKGLDEGLIAELQAMGPSASREIDALSKLTSDELNIYANVWKEKMALATSLAAKELEPNKLIKDSQIAELQGEFDSLQLKVTVAPPENVEEFANAGKELVEGLVGVFKDKQPEVDNTGKELVEGLVGVFKDKQPEVDNSGRELVEGLVGVFKDKEPEVVDTAAGIVEASNDEMLKSVPDYEATGEELIEAVDDGAEQKSGNLIDTCRNTMSKALEEVRSTFEDWVGAGRYVIEGFIDGIKEKINDAMDAAAEMARKAIQAANDELDINSPSRKFAASGQFVVLGFAKGIADNLAPAIESTKVMGKSVIDQFRNALNEIGDLSSADIDMTPTIRPVIDFTDFKMGAKQLNNMLPTNKTLTLDFTRINAVGKLISDNNINPSKERRDSTSAQPTIVNNFDCRGMVVREDADIDRIATRMNQKVQQSLRGRGSHSLIFQN